jgi:hypothetical protein
MSKQPKEIRALYGGSLNFPSPLRLDLVSDLFQRLVSIKAPLLWLPLIVWLFG